MEALTRDACRFERYTDLDCTEDVMNTSATKDPNKQPRFTPNMQNYRTSLGYEGIELKKSSEQQTIADLKRKYAR
jgi:hypothetical protein